MSKMRECIDWIIREARVLGSTSGSALAHVVFMPQRQIANAIGDQAEAVAEVQLEAAVVSYTETGIRETSAALSSPHRLPSESVCTHDRIDVVSTGPEYVRGLVLHDL